MVGPGGWKPVTESPAKNLHRMPMPPKRTNILMLILTAIVLTVAAAAGGCSRNPVTGKRELVISESLEIALGRDAAPQFEKRFGGRIRDAVLQNYINRVGQSLVGYSHRPHLQYHFAALRSKQVNAFALPGGWVYVTAGMLAKLSNEAQLAAVLGHEIGHVAARHVAQNITRELGLEAIVVAVGASTRSDRAEQLAKVVTGLIDLRFSREQELQADELGLQYSTAAGYNPRAMIDVMRILEDASRGSPPEFLSTHPSPKNRIAKIEQQIEAYYADAARTRPVDFGNRSYRRLVLDRLKRSSRVRWRSSPGRLHRWSVLR